MRGWAKEDQSKPVEIRWQRSKISKRKYQLASEAAHLAKEKKKHTQNDDFEKAHFCHLQSLKCEELRAEFGDFYNPTPNEHEEIPKEFIITTQKRSKNQPICLMVGEKDHKWTNVYENDVIEIKNKNIEHRYDDNLSDDVIAEHPNDYASHRGLTEVHGASGGTGPYIPIGKYRTMVPKNAKVTSKAASKQTTQLLPKAKDSKREPQFKSLDAYKRNNISKKKYSRGDRMIKAFAMMNLKNKSN